MHGTRNAVAHLQSTLATIVPDESTVNILCWLDDILLHCENISDMPDSIESFFDMCAKYNLRLHPGKCVLFSSSVRWCGRLISKDGVRYDPRGLNALQPMEPPTTGAHLQQFLCALQWVKNGIPNFVNLVSGLHKLMENIYSKAGCHRMGKRRTNVL